MSLLAANKKGKKNKKKKQQQQHAIQVSPSLQSALRQREKSEERKQNNQLLFEHRGREHASKHPTLTESLLKIRLQSVMDFQVILDPTETDSE